MELILDDGVSEIASEAYIGKNEIERVYIPASVEKIGSSAFKGCANLHEVDIEDGNKPLEIGESAFEGCRALHEIDLPTRANRFLRACFKDSGLEVLTIGHDGDFIASQDPEKFAGCPAERALNAILEEERLERAQKLFRRKRIEHQFPVSELLTSLQSTASGKIEATVLRSLYDRMVVDADFPISEYSGKYEAACAVYEQVEDWNAVDGSVVKSVVGGEAAKHVAAIDRGEIFDKEWSGDVVEKLRNVCADVKADAFDEAKLREAFYRIFSRVKHHAAFHRLMAIAHPKEFVQIPATAALVPLYAWLTKNNLPTVEQADWCELSRGVRSSLSKLLPEVDVYRAGAFAWFMADAFRNAPTGIRAVRKAKSLDWMRALGLIK